MLSKKEKEILIKLATKKNECLFKKNKGNKRDVETS